MFIYFFAVCLVMDDRLRRLERLARTSSVWSDVLRWRGELKKAGEGAVLDLGLPHQWEVVGSGNARYGQALVALRGLCAGDDGLHPFAGGVARPLTFKETVQARIDQFEHEGAAGLWTNWLDTSSAIVYQKDTTKFRIDSMSAALLNDVPASFRDAFLPVNYDDFSSFVELDVQDRDDVYNQSLTREQVLKHKGWLAVVEGDKRLLKRYSDIVFGQVQGGVAMAFWTVHRQDAQGRWVCPRQSQLRPLCAGNVLGYCYCFGRGLYYYAPFARVLPL